MKLIDDLKIRFDKKEKFRILIRKRKSAGKKNEFDKKEKSGSLGIAVPTFGDNPCSQL